MVAQLLLNILISFSIYLLISLSFKIVFQSSKFLHLSHAAVITLGAYFTYLLNIQFNFYLWLAILLAILGGTMVGACIELGVFNPLRKKSTSGWVFLLVSLGLYVILENLISLVWGAGMKTIQVGKIHAGNEIFGAYITDAQIVIVVVSITLFVGVLLLLQHTSFGKYIRALSSNPKLCRIYGINTSQVTLSAFALGSALAAIAGLLKAFDTNMTPSMGLNLLLYSVVVVIIAGVGSTKGLIGGAFLLATAQHLAAWYLDSKWMNAVAFIILILFLIWKPLGFSGKRVRKVEV